MTLAELFGQTLEHIEVGSVATAGMVFPHRHTADQHMSENAVKIHTSSTVNCSEGVAEISTSKLTSLGCQIRIVILYGRQGFPGVVAEAFYSSAVYLLS